MKRIKWKQPLYFLLFAMITFVSCQKDTTAVTEATETSDVIAVAGISGSILTTAKVGATDPSDSIYVIHECARGSHRDSIAAASLPATITSYLATNYAGYTFQKAYTVEDRNNVITGYVVVIVFNGNPVGLEFNAAGSFLRVLEQREGKDRQGKGWHNGGRFDDRDGKRRDTVALTALPAAVTSYFAANYALDTLVAAFRNRDSSLLVLSKNNGVFATVFTAAGSFISHIQLPAKGSRAVSVEQAALPSKVLSYLTTTYPAYVFKKAFAVNANNILQGYVVVIDASAIKYAVQFDASGNFVKAVTIR
jgi:hypothetical protein